MSNLNILSENLIKENSVELSMITGSENPNFPLTNIPHNFTTKVFRSNENTCEFLIDLKQVRNIDVIALVGSNLTGFGYTEVNVTLSATNDFTGLSSQNIPISLEYNFGYLEITPTVARYIKIELTSTGSYCEFSNIFIGEQIKFEYNGLSQDGFKFGVLDNSNRRSNQYGQDFINVRNQVKFLNGNVRFANKEEVDLLDEVIIRHINGNPLWLIIDQCDQVLTDGRFRLSGYYRINNRPNFTASGPGLFNTSLTFQEIV